MYWLLYWAIPAVVQTIIGYDCGSRSMNITTVSLLDVGPCDVPLVEVNATKVYAQLLQLDEFTENTVVQCKIEIRRTVHYCGEAEYLVEISKNAYQGAHLTGILRLGHNHIISGIGISQTRVYPLVFAGYVGQDGRCNGAAYADLYGSWESVVVQGTAKITLYQQNARVSLNNNKLYLRSGTSCVLTDETCIDADGGYTFWDSIPADNCRFYQYGVLYEGYTFKLKDLRGQHEEIVYTLSTEDVTFALTARNEINLCGYRITRTEHPKLFIFETQKGISFTPRGRVSIANLDIFAYVNSKFVYVEKYLRSQTESLYRDVLIQRCELERQTLKNALAIATQSPNQFAYNLMRGPGYMAVLAGEVVHIVKCIPVEVKLDSNDECYAQLRVSRQNITYYLTPKTHILKAHGTSIPCNKILPVYYFIEKEWYKFNPQPDQGKKPITLQPISNPTWQYVNPADLATSGIYTTKNLDELRDQIMFPVEKPALLNNIAKEMHGQPYVNEEETLSQLINENTVDKIVTSAWDRLWNKFITFGSASTGVLAIIILL